MEHVSLTNGDKNEEKLEIKKAEMTQKLQKREEDRLADVQKRKEEKSSSSAINESLDFFIANFNRSKREIEEALVNAEDVERSKLQDHFVTLTQKLQTLQKFTADTVMFLPPYEIQKAQETMGKLQKDIQEARDKLIPKKKFAFKSKKKAGAESTSKPKEQVSSAKKEIKMEFTDCSFADQSSQTLIKKSEETNEKDVALARLKDCVVKIYGSPRAIHIDQLTNCKVLTGPVAGSVFMDHCENCTFVMACQQLRIHHTTKSHFYIHVTSKAIIEDCTAVKFAPYNWEYEGSGESYALSGLDRSRNNWDDVDDFNWLASDVHSPNWGVLDEANRVKSWDL